MNISTIALFEMLGLPQNFEMDDSTERAIRQSQEVQKEP
jgi:hypothetical protein